MNTPHYLIIFRTCDVVQSVHNAPRPFGLDKRELIKMCFLSLYEAVQGYHYTIHILADKLSDELTAFFFIVVDGKITCKYLEGNKLKQLVENINIDIR